MEIVVLADSAQRTRYRVQGALSASGVKAPQTPIRHLQWLCYINRGEEARTTKNSQANSLLNFSEIYKSDPR